MREVIAVGNADEPGSGLPSETLRHEQYRRDDRLHVPRWKVDQDPTTFAFLDPAENRREQFEILRENKLLTWMQNIERQLDETPEVCTCQQDQVFRTQTARHGGLRRCRGG